MAYVKQKLKGVHARATEEARKAWRAVQQYVGFGITNFTTHNLMQLEDFHYSAVKRLQKNGVIEPLETRDDNKNGSRGDYYLVYKIADILKNKFGLIELSQMDYAIATRNAHSSCR